MFRFYNAPSKLSQRALYTLICYASAETVCLHSCCLHILLAPQLQLQHAHAFSAYNNVVMASSGCRLQRIMVHIVNCYCIPHLILCSGHHYSSVRVCSKYIRLTLSNTGRIYGRKRHHIRYIYIHFLLQLMALTEKK